MSITQNLDELKGLSLWVNYILYPAPRPNDPNHKSKPPINPATLWNGSTTDGATWTDYRTAAGNIGKTATYKPQNKDVIRATIDGAGLVLAAGYCGIDFDNVIDEAGNVAPFAAAILERLDTYTEYSPSGRGLHSLLYCGDLLEAGKDFGKQFLLDKAGNITDEAGKACELEVYFYRNGGRYFTVTGNAYQDKPINRTKGGTLRAIFDEYTEKTNAYRAAKLPASSVGSVTRTATQGTAATEDGDRKMIESALAAIDPSALDFGEWAATMTALKVLGFDQIEAEAWSSGGLCGRPNPKNDPKTNYYRWPKFTFKNGDENAAGIIINSAKRFNWTPADAFDEADRREYGRKLHARDWTEEDEAGLREWLAKKAEERKAEQMNEAQKAAAAFAVGSQTTAEEKPTAISLENWKAAGYFSAILEGYNAQTERDDKREAVGYKEYKTQREALEKEGFHIIGETFQTEAQYLPGFLTYEAAVNEFTTADDHFIELKSFPQFSKAAKIKRHDSIVIAADTGKGKSSLAINFLNDLNDEYPVLYFNLEMDGLTILRRLVSIRTGILLDDIEQYQHDSTTAGKVNAALRALTSRKPLQILEDVYNLEAIEETIKRTTAGREDPTIVIIDHALLVNTEARVNGRYERFTHISEELRRIARLYNVVMFILLQQNRAGKDNENEAPKNSSLKESGSWENDATHITFLWEDKKDTENGRYDRKQLSITKNRHGEKGTFVLDYHAKTQTYKEAPDGFTLLTSEEAPAPFDPDDDEPEFI